MPQTAIAMTTAAPAIRCTPRTEIANHRAVVQATIAIRADAATSSGS